MKILIVKLSSIGDIVHTLPTLAAIRRHLPKAEISWVVEKKCAEILRDNKLLTNLIEIDTKAARRRVTFSETLKIMREQRRELRRENFDLAFDFQGLLKSAMIAKISGARQRIGFAKDALREPPSRWLMTATKTVALDENIIYKNLSLAAETLNFKIPSPEELEFPIFTDENHEREADKIAAKTGTNFAILNVGGGWKTKLWQAENFGKLADKLFTERGLKSVISFGPGEENAANRALNAARSSQPITANPSLRGFYALAKRAKIYVGGDTSLMHLAVAAKTPVVGIFGPTEWWRNGSPYPQDVCIERTDITCRENCHRRTCQNWICLDIEVGRVSQAVNHRLSQNQ